MTAQPAAKQKTATGPDESQRRASDPARSVWVGASAGSGKTKVLTDRVLRLFLPRADGTPGTKPHRILCLTFTKAAASEMRLRLSSRLSEWAVMEDEHLARELADLFGHEPDDKAIDAARRLFAAVTDAPGGLNIMTIHSFCQSVLGRFPLEAGLPPHFGALDEAAAAALFSRARNDIVARAQCSTDSPEGRALHAVAAAAAEDGFDALLQNIAGESRAFRELLQKHGGMDGLSRAVYETLDLAPGESGESVVAAACRKGQFDERGLRESCRVMAECGTASTDHPAAAAIQNWLDAPEEKRVRLWPSYRGAFLTKEGEPRKNVPTKKPKEAFPDIAHIVGAEAQRITGIEDRRKAALCGALTGHLMVLGNAVLGRYEDLKTARAALDFDDLVNKALSLLERRGMADWVMFKLDGGIDHILIDEAQDTNPEQWRIVAALCDDFFSGRGAREDSGRTVFAVGDEKQSIYSFQRAAPEKFREMRAFFSERVQAAKQNLAQEEMNVSFRSVPAVLAAVDETFKPDSVREGLGSLPLRHESFRAGQAGLVEIWPVFATPEREDRGGWELPVTVRAAQGGGAKLADHIGITIKNWLDSGEELTARGRAIAPGDIMILVRRRSAFVGQLVRSLKTRGIPVGGADRMVLRGQLAVQDLIAAAQFALLPSDDLSLACVLKSPLVGWDDAALERVAAGRSGALWREIQNCADKNVSAYLQRLVSFARNNSAPYEFFSMILSTPCPADARGGLHALTGRLGAEAVDPVEEFLNMALSSGQDDLPTLENFLLSFMRGDSEIKREQEESGGCVRIMTVHGAKGLQAPVVFLPDTLRAAGALPGSAGQRLLWPDKSGLNAPLWSPRGDADCALYARTRTKLEARQDEEYRRLLYVAMTRTEDRLYICGHTGRRAPAPENWHAYIWRALEGMEDVEREPFPAVTDGALLRLRGEQGAPVKGDSRKPAPPSAARSAADTAFPWLYTQAPAEKPGTRPLSPSRVAGARVAEPPVFSPRAGQDLYRFRRGIVTHKLLQFLPDVANGNILFAARRFVDTNATDLPEAIRASIVRETVAILENPDFAPLFGQGATAEVPVSGIIDGTPISGQIDRLLVTDSEIWIADYKTNRPPPTDESGIPETYRLQMKYYSDIVSNIYKNKHVRCFLIWTDGPRMMELNFL